MAISHDCTLNTADERRYFRRDFSILSKSLRRTATQSSRVHEITSTSKRKPWWSSGLQKRRLSRDHKVIPSVKACASRITWALIKGKREAWERAMKLRRIIPFLFESSPLEMDPHCRSFWPFVCLKSAYFILREEGGKAMDRIPEDFVHNPNELRDKLWWEKKMLSKIGSNWEEGGATENKWKKMND